MKRLLHSIADYLRECDKLLFALCIGATLFASLEVLSSTYYVLGGLRQFIMHLVGLCLGVAAAVVISKINYRTLMRYWMPIGALFVLLVILTFFIGYAPQGTDDKAWIVIGGISVQPAEFLKFAFLLSFAWHTGKIGDKIHKIHHILLLCLHGAFPVLLIHEQGDDGTALVFAIMFVAMMFAAGLKARYFAIAGSAVVIGAPMLYFFIMNEAQKARIYALLFPSEEDYLGVLWQQTRGRTALANGGFFGKGLFNGPLVQTKGGIPEGYNDFIFCSIGEELGMLGCLAVILLLLAISLRILRNGTRTTDRSGFVICVGVFAMIASQSLINIGMNVSLIPVIGITLPFFSAGGTSLLSLFMSLGLVMSVYMHRTSGAIYLRD